MIARALANQLKRTVVGPMWHGASLFEALAGVTADEAARHPVAGAHSIWELVLHVAAWAEIAAVRLGGTELIPTTQQDWPPVGEPTLENWNGALARLRAAYDGLARATKELYDDALAAPVPGGQPPHSMEVMLRGVVEHGAYHGGQIALLRRALGAPPA